MAELATRDPFSGGSAKAVADAWGANAEKAERKQAEATNGAAPDTKTDDGLGEKPDNPFEAPESQDAIDEASTETESESEPDEPALAPPPSWSDDEKELFKGLPLKAQQAIARKHTEADRLVTSKTTEIASERKQIEALKAQFQQGLVERFQKLDQLIVSMDAKEPDWQAILDGEGVVAFNQKRLAWDSNQKARESLKAERDKIGKEQSEEQNRNLLAYAEAEHRSLAEKWPEFVDQAKGKTVKGEVNSYLVDIGYSQAEINSVLDHRAMVVVRDALKYRALQKAKPEVEKKLREAPPMRKSGPSSDTDRDAEAHRKARQMVQKRPSSREAHIGLLRHHLKP